MREREIFHKDFFYLFLPLSILDKPELVKQEEDKGGHNPFLKVNIFTFDTPSLWNSRAPLRRFRSRTPIYRAAILGVIKK